MSAAKMGDEFSLGQRVNAGEPAGEDPAPAVHPDILGDAHLEVGAAKLKTLFP